MALRGPLKQICIQECGRRCTNSIQPRISLQASGFADFVATF
jgi:hypothetical protein